MLKLRLCSTIIGNPTGPDPGDMFVGIAIAARRPADKDPSIRFNRHGPPAENLKPIWLGLLDILLASALSIWPLTGRG